MTYDNTTKPDLSIFILSIISSIIIGFLCLFIISFSIYYTLKTIQTNQIFIEVSQKIIKYNQNNEHHKAINLSKKIQISFWTNYNMLDNNVRLTHTAKLALADSLEKNGNYDLAAEQYRMILGFSDDQFSTLQLLMNEESYFSLKQLATKQVH